MDSAKGKTGEKGCIFTLLWDETTTNYNRAFYLVLSDIWLS